MAGHDRRQIDGVVVTDHLARSIRREPLSATGAAMQAVPDDPVRLLGQRKGMGNCVLLTRDPENKHLAGESKRDECVDPNSRVSTMSQVVKLPEVVELVTTANYPVTPMVGTINISEDLQHR